ncbi:MAG: SAM hydrolase/SAM-dependent halogenase family protein [Rubrobacter sp.]
MRAICFLSDFGLTDDFVGTCKGVIVKIFPEARVIDLTHSVPSFGIEAGAELLQHATRYMPDGAVYLAVVDPGVGTSRREIALETTRGALLVGPDNGLLIPASEALGGITRAVHLTNDAFHIHPVAKTFHGRDVFSPVAAHLATGVELSELGEPLRPDSLAALSLADEVATSGDIKAHVIDVDRYGNARLSVKQEGCGLDYGEELYLDVGDGDMQIRYVPTFGSATSGELILIPDSHWRLSVSVNQGNASRALSLAIGTKITIKREGG